MNGSAMNGSQLPAVAADFARLEALIDALEASGGEADDSAAAGAETARALVALVLDVHRAGLARLVELVADSPDLDALAARMLDDAPVRGLLLLHGLHPETLDARIEAALADMHAALGVHGLTLREHRRDENRLTLALAGDVTGRTALLASVPAEIEALMFAAAPELDEIVIEHPQLTQLRPPHQRADAGHVVVYRSRALTGEAVPREEPA